MQPGDEIRVSMGTGSTGLTSTREMALSESNGPTRSQTTGRASNAFGIRLLRDPVFLRDGDELVYTVQENATQLSLMRLKLTDGTSERLHPAAIVSEVEAAFTPDGRFCAFLQIRKQLVIRDTKRNQDVQIPSVGLRRPSIAPDGSRVIFSIPAANGQQIQSVNNQGQDRQFLTQRGFNSWPAFGPDGKRIAFGRSLDGNYDIYVMNADGSNPRRLTNSPGLNDRAGFSCTAA